MIKKTIIIICLFVIAGLNTGYTDKTEWWVIDCGGGVNTSSGGGYKNQSALVSQLGIGKSFDSKTYTSMYAGYAAEDFKTESTRIIFYDPYPSEEKMNDSSSINCKVTVESLNNAIDTATVRYRISNSGRSISKFSKWYKGAKQVKRYNSKKMKYSIEIPNSAGRYFKPGGDNYIQWRCWDKNSNEAESKMFRVKVKEIDFAIIQPVDFSGSRPVFEVGFDGAIDKDTIELTVNKVNSSRIFKWKGDDDYKGSTGIYKKRYMGEEFIAGEEYSLTVSVRDSGGTELSKTIKFVVNDGIIADLIPYPSPFDPSKEGVTIRYVLDETALVSISIYDTAGELVKVIVDKENRPAGLNDSDMWYAMNYADKALANGVYLCEIIAEDNNGEHRRYVALAVLR